jgi:hypothetical protein
MSRHYKWPRLMGDWYCIKCDWEGDSPAAKYYKENGEIYADETWCPECKDGGQLETGFRPVVDQVEEDEA